MTRCGCGLALLHAEWIRGVRSCHPCRVRRAVVERGARRLAMGESSLVVIGDVVAQIERLEREGSQAVGGEVGVVE